jgi:hypothetical protein
MGVVVTGYVLGGAWVGGGAGVRTDVVCAVVTAVGVPKNRGAMLVAVAMPCPMPMEWAASRMVWPR